jgi:peptide/nickel transport system permease protein
VQYLLRRVGLLLLTLWVALTVNFALPRLMPGNPLELMMGKLGAQGGQISPSAAKAIAKAYGLDNSHTAISQYFTYIHQTALGHFGLSISEYPEKVSTLIGQELPWTIGLVGCAVVIAFVVGTAIGAMAAWRRGGFFDSILVPTGVMLQAMPAFWLGILLLYFMAYRFGWFNVSSTNEVEQRQLASLSGLWAIVQASILPAVALVAVSLGGYIILMRNTMVTVMSDDFVKFARAKGLPDRIVATRYAARNAILPVFTNFALSLGFVVAGAIAIEVVFDYPGIADQLLAAVEAEDYPLMQAIFLIIVLGVLLANFISDLVYVYLDPRIRLGGRT